MPRTCTICGHKKRAAIEKAVLAGESLRNIAQRYGTSPTALFRHKNDHLTNAVVKAAGAAEVAHGEGLLAKLESIETEARTLLQAALRGETTEEPAPKEKT